MGKLLTPLVLALTAFLGGLILFRAHDGYGVTDSKVDPEAIDRGVERLAFLRSLEAREQAGFKADQSTQDARRTQLERLAAAGLIRSAGFPTRSNSEQLVVTPQFLALDFADKNEIARRVFYFVFEISDNAPVSHIKFQRLVLLDSKNNHEVGIVTCGAGGVSLTMHH